MIISEVLIALKLDPVGQLPWLLRPPAEKEPILTSQTLYCLSPRMTRECGNSLGHIQSLFGIFFSVCVCVVIGVRGRDVAVAPSFASPWEHMPSELITCLEGPIKLPLNAPQTKEPYNRMARSEKWGGAI